MAEQKRGGWKNAAAAENGGKSAGRPPKSGITRKRRSVNISPFAWYAFEARRLPGESLNDTIERIALTLPE